MYQHCWSCKSWLPGSGILWVVCLGLLRKARRKHPRVLLFWSLYGTSIILWRQRYLAHNNDDISLSSVRILLTLTSVLQSFRLVYFGISNIGGCISMLLLSTGSKQHFVLAFISFVVCGRKADGNKNNEKEVFQFVKLTNELIITNNFTKEWTNIKEEERLCKLPNTTRTSSCKDWSSHEKYPKSEYKLAWRSLMVLYSI